MISKSLLRTSLLFSLALLMQSKIFGVDKSYESPTATKRTVSKRDFYAPLSEKFSRQRTQQANEPWGLVQKKVNKGTVLSFEDQDDVNQTPMPNPFLQKLKRQLIEKLVQQSIGPKQSSSNPRTKKIDPVELVEVNKNLYQTYFNDVFQPMAEQSSEGSEDGKDDAFLNSSWFPDISVFLES